MTFNTIPLQCHAWLHSLFFYLVSHFIVVSCICRIILLLYTLFNNGFCVHYFLIIIIFVDATAVSNSHFGDGSGPYHLSRVRCNGHERNLTECSHNPIGYHNCLPGSDIGVRCDGKIKDRRVYI